MKLSDTTVTKKLNHNKVRKAIFRKKAYQDMLCSDVREKLHMIAEEQTALLAV